MIGKKEKKATRGFSIKFKIRVGVGILICKKGNTSLGFKKRVLA
jgi:hypothetical protein